MATSDAWDGVRNLGPISIAQLRGVGIDTPAGLWQVGPVDAYLRLRRAHPGRINRTMLWALAGAELDLDWRELPTELKAQLDADVAAADVPGPGRPGG